MTAMSPKALGLLLKTCSTGYEGFLSPVSGQEPFDVDEA